MPGAIFTTARGFNWQMPYESVLPAGTTHAWHHYAVVWDAEGLPGTKAPDGGPAVVQVYLDGQPIPTQGRQTVSFGGKHLRSIASHWGKIAFPTPSNGWNPSKSHIHWYTSCYIFNFL